MPLKTDTVEEPNLNLTPMIDIVFLLIIFFMVGTRFTDLERQYEIQLPKVADARPLTGVPDAITINISNDGQIEVNKSVRTLEELKDDLTAARERYDDQAVVIRADGESKVQHAMDVLSVTMKAGIRNHSLAYKIKPEGAL